MRTSDLDYHLPPERIATRPVQPRDAARLLVISRSDAHVLEHHHVRDLPHFVREGDVMAFNRTRVLPARLAGRRRDTGGGVGGLFVEAVAPAQWRVMLRVGGKLYDDCVVDLVDAHARAVPGASLRLLRRDAETWIAQLEGEIAALPLEAALARVGATPLPPYILWARKRFDAGELEDLDRAWYQTVFAAEQPDAARSIAAPTAGLHFTPELLAHLDAHGVRRELVTLHVGAGTFKPVETPTLEEHPMHAEWHDVPPRTMDAIAAARAAGGRVFGVGTTTARALESAAVDGAAAGWTRLLIAPGHQWRAVDALLTNFHLPRSTLLAMVASLLPGGVPQLLEVYRHAIEREYRFYSYGDAMLILP